MSSLEAALLGLAVFIAVYAVLLVTLALLGRRTDAEALVRFIPDCTVLLSRLLRDPAVPRRRRLILLALVGYLVFPLDLVPDFLPVVGQLDDVIVAALALRLALRSGGPDLIRHHWPGPERSLGVVLAIAYGRSATTR